MTWRLLVVLVAFSVLAPQCDARRTESLHLVADAMGRYKKSDFSAARQKLSDAVAVDDRNDLAHYYLGILAYHQFRDPGNAVKHLRRASELVPEETEYHYQLGTALVANGDLQAAQGHLQLVIDVRPEHAGALFRLADVRRGEGRLRSAADLYVRSIRSNPRFFHPYVMLTDLYLERGYAREAVAVATNCTRNLPGQTACIHALGRGQMRLGEFAASLRSFDQVLAQDGDEKLVLFNAAMAHRALGHQAETMAMLKRFLRHADRQQDGERVRAAEQILAGGL